jgi:hypothetical protein
MGKGPDWTKTGTIVAYAEWLRKKSGALTVMIVRRDDAALAADPRLAASDAADLIEQRVVGLAVDLARARKEKRAAARLELGELHE